MSNDVIENIEIFNPGSRVLFDVTVEVPRGTKNRYKMDRLAGRIRLDRILFTSIQYPYDYGFIEGILGLDGDPLDTVVISAEPTFPDCLIQCYAVTMSRMTDEVGSDDEVLRVSTADTRHGHLKDFDLVIEYILPGIEYSFSVYKDLEPSKSVGGATQVGRKETEEEIIAPIECTRGASFGHHHVNLA